MKSLTSDRERWFLGRELWYPFGEYRMRYLRLAPAVNGENPRPPLVLIHGLLGYSFSWRHNLEALARERDVLAVDLLGIGYSDRPRLGSVNFGCRATATRMLTWMAALGLENVDLLGTSHGGAVAMTMAALERERQERPIIGRLMLAAPANPWSELGAGRIAFFGTQFGRWLARLLLEQCAVGRRALCSVALRRMYGDPRKLTAETLDGYMRMAVLPGTIEYALEVVRTWNEDMRELKVRFPLLADVPTLILWGSRDRAVDPRSAYELTSRLKQSRLVVMEGAGHMPYEESPADFTRLALDFLNDPLPQQPNTGFYLSSRSC